METKTEEQLEAICEKYGLIYAESRCYTGVIPEEILQKIKNMRPLAKCDEYDGGYLFSGAKEDILELSMCGNRRLAMESVQNYIFEQNDDIRRHKPVFIAAGRKFFNLNGLEKTGKRGYIEPPLDPPNIGGGGFFNLAIPLLEAMSSKRKVFKEKEEEDGAESANVKFAFRWCRGGVQIITEWGEEANDPALVIPELN
jgi:hypothetical protein